MSATAKVARAATAGARPPRARLAGAAPLLVLLLIPAAILAFSRILLIDDAFITYRYAYHFALGQGLVFNPGERVEGSTSLLWTLLTALPIGLGWPIHRWAPALGLLFGLLALLDAGQICRRLGLSRPATLVGLAALSLFPGYWLVLANGMEGGMLAFFLTRTLALTLGGRPLAAGVFGGLLFLVRPDSAAVLPLCALYQAARTARARGATPRVVARRAAPMLLPWLAILGGMTLWRLAYYGAWVPNTITAKSPPQLTATILQGNIRDGLLYWWQFATEAAPLALGLLLALLVARRRAIVWLGLGLLAVQFPVILINGGDWIPHHRLLTVYAPLLAIVLAVAVDALLPEGWRGGPRRGQVARVAVLLLLLASVALPLRANRWEATPAVRINQQGVVCTDYRALAEALRPALTPDDRLAPEALGIFSYLLRDTYTHDLLGLTDSYLARHGTHYWAQIGKSDLRYTYQVARPTVLIFHSGLGFPNDFYHLSGGRFDADYAAFTLQGLKACAGTKTILILSRESLPRLLPAVARFDPRPLTLGTP